MIALFLEGPSQGGWRAHRLSVDLLFTRIAALATVIVNLTLLNVTTPVDCQVSVILEMVPRYLALAAASLLLVLRIIAIWENNMVAVTIASGIWGINSAFLIQGISRLRYAREVPGGPCVALNIQATKLTMIVAFISDILLLIMMLRGLFLRGYHQRSALYTGRFLWSQGIIWLFLAIISGILPTVFVCLNLNGTLLICLEMKC
ncbi:hypothetical protein BJV77DRAFT_471102 [Russula vinacea]|nr:hypothetical protein BJV77DRAFT_471102 [Russula vinacea]